MDVSLSIRTPCNVVRCFRINSMRALISYLGAKEQDWTNKIPKFCAGTFGDCASKGIT